MSERRILRVFPRRTHATPEDPLAVIGAPGLFIPECDEIHVSVAFQWDLPDAYKLAEHWQRTARVRTILGGPATGQPSGEFVPGRYLRQGFTITSRGCPHHCWYCSVWKREPRLVELPIRDGHIVQDDNLLACSEHHVREVFKMLRRQKQAAELRALEARLFTRWVAEELTATHFYQVFFAYDKPEDYEPLRQAAALIKEYGLESRSKKFRVYVLCGYRGDTLTAASDRMYKVLALNMWPFPQLYLGPDGKKDPGWQKFQKLWARPAAQWHLKRAMTTAEIPEEDDYR
jgi:hypothetical protein